MAVNGRASWRNKLRPNSSNPLIGESTETAQREPISPIHSRVNFVLQQLASGNTAKLGLPGEEQLRGILLRKAESQLENLTEEELTKYVVMLAGVCDGIINGGEKWELVIANSDGTKPDTGTAEEFTEAVESSAT